jgi:hypothetical protein
VLRDTPVTPYTRPPVSTDLATRNRPGDGNLIAIYGNLTAFCRILLYSAKSTKFYYILPSLLNPTKFYQDRYPNPILPYYGPYIGSSSTTKKGHGRVSQSSAGRARTSRAMGRGVAESHDGSRGTQYVSI